MKRLLLILTICIMSTTAMAYDEKGFFEGDVSVEIDYISYENFDYQHCFTIKKKYPVSPGISFALSAGTQAIDLGLEKIRMFPVGLHLVSTTDTKIPFEVDLSAKYVSIASLDNEVFYTGKAFIKIPVVSDGFLKIGSGYQYHEIYKGWIVSVGVETNF